MSASSTFDNHGAYWNMCTKKTLSLGEVGHPILVFEWRGNIAIVTSTHCMIAYPTFHEHVRCNVNLVQLLNRQQLDEHLRRCFGTNESSGIENVVFWTRDDRLHIAPSSNSAYILFTAPSREYDILIRWWYFREVILRDLTTMFTSILVTVYRCDMSEVDNVSCVGDGGCGSSYDNSYDNAMMRLSRDQYRPAVMYGGREVKFEFDEHSDDDS